MASIGNSVRTNKRILLLIAGLLVVIIVFLTRFYISERRENRALRIKLLSMNENKRTPKPWSALLNRPQVLTAAPAKITTPSSATASADGTKVESVQEMDTQTLANRLAMQMRRPKNLEAQTLDNNVAIADEIISREPESYGAYKAKLISLLVKEGKFKQVVDEGEIESLLESMVQFNISSDKLGRREAALLGHTTTEIQNAEDQLEALVNDKMTIEAQLSDVDASTPEYAQLSQSIQEIENKEALLSSNIEALEESLAINTNQMINEDVVEIPFMRMMAKGDYSGVADNAQSFIEQFPTSANGYFYLVRALEQQGQKEEARDVIQNAKLPRDVQAGLLQRLEAESAETPETYWQKLNF